MRLKHLALIPALLIMPACGNSSRPASSASHPPIADLTCPDEPDIAAMLEADPSGVTFDAAVRKAGQDCRDALARVCRWHKERGAEVTCPDAIRP